MSNRNFLVQALATVERADSMNELKQKIYNLNSMRFQDLNLPVGAPVSLELFSSDAGTEYPAQLIGYSAAKSIIFSAPRLKIPTSNLPGADCMIRFFTSGNAYSFEVKILAHFTEPYEHLHVAFPTHLNSVVVRTQPRFPVTLPLTNKVQERASITMVDVSMFGARLVSSVPLGEIHDHFKLDLCLPLANGERTMRLDSVIRYVRRFEPNSEGSDYHHGVEFKALSAEDKVTIQQFINEQQRPSSQDPLAVVKS